MSRRGSGSNDLSKDVSDYSKAWMETMINIWQEKMMMMRRPEGGGFDPVYDTGALHSSLVGRYTSTDRSTVIEHKFLEYGMFVDRGTGRGYRKGNGGNLKFLDPAYRAAHKLGLPRYPRPWYNKKYFASVMKLHDDFERIFADKVEAVMSDAFKRGSYKRG